MSEKAAQFPTTRWTLVMAAGDEGSRQEALNWLCDRYWYPIYAFLRRHGHAPAAAQDFTQGFLLRFLERRSMEGADPKRGRFRSYVLGALKNYLADCQDHTNALMRGGGLQFLPLSFTTGEERYLQCPENLSPEALYERQWALSLLSRVLDLMRAEQEAAGKAALFDRLKSFLTADADYRQAAAGLGMQEGAVRVTVHRLRRRYRDLLTAEIAETVAEAGEVQREIRYLIGILSA